MGIIYKITNKRETAGQMNETPTGNARATSWSQSSRLTIPSLSGLGPATPTLMKQADAL